ncbi:NACHT domain-containing protein [Methylobacter tundripaludum]|uniref:NACHT domain-containing protein n=1 Tax=Methylobacter tundripaludum TaxID=173365 RepID=UPI000690EB8D|nr:NACHT domain-containing protein [Methylobacter tundripaludum]
MNRSTGLKISQPALSILLILGLAVVFCPNTPLANPPVSTKIQLEIDLNALAVRHVENDKAMDTGLAVNLYGDNKAGVERQEVAVLYEQAYSKAKEAKLQSWSSLRPEAGWLFGAFGLIVAVFRNSLSDLIKLILKTISNWLYSRLAGQKFLRKTALRHYRKALVRKYESVRIPFRDRAPLKMAEVFVPLQVTGRVDAVQMAAMQAISRFKRLMVVGEPGAGKTMLMKHVAFHYAEHGLDGYGIQAVPVLLELNRAADPNTSLLQHLVHILEQNDFPRAEHYVEQALDKGELLLLFDGLDEVSYSERGRVVNAIKDLLANHPDCPVVITCRRAVYQNEFFDVVDETLLVKEFADAQIRQFLNAWAPDMPVDKSVDQLLGTLQDRPRLKDLARNPLLLTIIAYLYADTEHVLPHSRAEFYKLATDVLLRQWHQERNHYQPHDKHAVLEHLALYLHGADEQNQDRRSIDHENVLLQLKDILPRLNLDAGKDANNILKEIVERSGLLLEIDGGERYQFGHLTLQEFFVASALQGQGQELIQAYRQDPGGWREPVKLWCGLAVDSTEVVKAVCQVDAITGLECLADAKQVDPELADNIIEHFCGELAQGVGNDSVAHALGAVAGDTRPRGQQMLARLEQVLTESTQTEARQLAANALSFTNLPKAAEVLAIYYVVLPEVRQPLVRMGELAVFALGKLAAAGSRNAMEDLGSIATPRATLELVPLLWGDNSSTIAAAWQLACLIGIPENEEALRQFKLTAQQRSQTWHDWVWAPFAEPKESALPVIAGRIALLLEQNIKNLVTIIPRLNQAVDPRIALPVLLCSEKNLRALKNGMQKILDNPAPELSKFLENIKTKMTSISELNLDLHNLIEQYGKENIILQVFNLSGNEQLKAKAAQLKKFILEAADDLPASVTVLVNELAPRQFGKLLQAFKSFDRKPKEDWRNSRSVVGYSMESGWHFMLAGIMALLLIASSLYAMGLYCWENWQYLVDNKAYGTVTALTLIVLLIVPVPHIFDIYGSFKFGFLLLCQLIAVGAVLSIITLSARSIKTSNEIKKWIFVLTLSLAIWWLGVLILYFAANYVHQFYSWPWVAALLLAWYGCAIALVVIAIQKEHQANNPLAGII